MGNQNKSLRVNLYKKKRGLIKYFTKLKKHYINPLVDPLLVKGKPKIFCIGCNKTGTTSVKKAFEDLGFIVGDQRKAEKLIHEYFDKNFDPIIEYSHTAQVFQDVPFSFPETYKYLDQAFPDAKFILTIRDSPEQWYNSLTKYHARMFGKGEIPTSQQLKDHPYVWKGWIWTYIHKLYKASEENPYDKDTLIQSYLAHNHDVCQYFKDRPKKLLVINLEEEDAYQKFCSFIGISSPYNNFPWENKTAEFRIRV